MLKRECTREEDLPSPRQTVTAEANIVPLTSPFASFVYNGPESPRKRPRLAKDPAEEGNSSGPAAGPTTNQRRSSNRLKSSQGSSSQARVKLANLETESTSSKDAASKKSRAPKGYAPPEKYAHLRELQDVIDENLDVLFCGINPGKKSAEIGHHFGHPSNQFWYCLHHSGFTSRQLSPTEEFDLPEQFRLGITDLVDRPTSEESELSVQDKVDGIPNLLNKVSKYRPHILCFVSLDNAKIVQTQINRRYKSKGVKPGKSGLGLQSYKMVHETTASETSDGGRETLFYAVPSTSGLVRTPQREGKVEIFKQLYQLLQQQKSGELDTTQLRIISPL